jgi:hypothetical protein
MERPAFRKSISLLLPVADWRALRREAAQRRIPMTALCREWLEPALARLRQSTLSPENPCESEC